VRVAIQDSLYPFTASRRKPILGFEGPLALLELSFDPDGWKTCVQLSDGVDELLGRRALRLGGALGADAFFCSALGVSMSLMTFITSS
jgi:hypothetical protein